MMLGAAMITTIIGLSYVQNRWFYLLYSLFVLKDDIVILTTSREMCLAKFAVIQQFCVETGMVINKSKTKLIDVNGANC